MQYSDQETSRRPGCGWIAAGILIAMLATGYIIAGLAEPNFFANPVSQSFAWMARGWALLGDADRAYNAANRAADMESNNITYLSLNCRYGALAGHPEPVMASCDRAVTAQSDSLRVRDSRGIARMIAGDYPGAIEDFSFVVETMHEAGFSGGNVAQRERFIEAMQAGQNPVTEDDLESLLIQ